MEARSEALEIKYAAATRTIEALKTAIYTVFEETGCSTPATRELLGGAGVTEANVLQFLALIEQRACEIMQVYLQRLARTAAAAVPVRHCGARGAVCGVRTDAVPRARCRRSRAMREQRQRRRCARARRTPAPARTAR